MVHIVNEWRMRQQIPAAIRSMLKIGEVGWIDRNSWNSVTGTCTWTIEPSFLGDYIACSGADHVHRGHGRPGNPRRICR